MEDETNPGENKDFTATPVQKIKYPRKALTIEERIQVIQRSENGESARKIAVLYNVGKTQIQSIINGKERVMEEWMMTSAGQKYARPRKMIYRELNDRVWEWYCQMKGTMPITGTLIQQKAKQFSTEMPNCEDFSASNGWLHSFKARHNIKLSGDGGDVVQKSANSSKKLTVTIGKKPSRQSYYSNLKHKCQQQIVDNNQSKMLHSEQCKISIGEHIYKWNELRQKLGLKFDYELAGILLERYFETLELYEASTLRHGSDSMTMHTEWESPDMADDSHSTTDEPLETSYLFFNKENYPVHTREGTDKVTDSSSATDYDLHTSSTQSINSANTLEDEEICNTVRYNIKQELMDTEEDENFSSSNVDNMSHLKTSIDIKVEPCDSDDTHDQQSHQNENIYYESMCDSAQQNNISELRDSRSASCQKHGDSSKHSQDSMVMSASYKRQNQKAFKYSDRLKADIGHSPTSESNIVSIEVNYGEETEKMFVVPTVGSNYAQNDFLNNASDAGQRCSQ